MLLRGALVQRGLRWGALGLAGVVIATALGSAADARARRHHHRHHHRAVEHARYEPPVASIVVDANTGAALESTNPDAPRHPASLTKLMTLYLLFDRLATGKMQLSTRLPVSAHAAAQAPSKLGLEPGETISVEDAIRAICTKSANDVAVIVAEAIGGDEPSFAKMMTAKAHALGMTHTSYHNASGLPDDQQITTARDIATLALALQTHFPQYYHYFSLRSFAWHGHAIRNHNHLLGRVPGLDGLKTGYIRASGFNIATSVRRGGRSIVAVVFGGHTARARDARVVDLIDDNIKIASTGHAAPQVADSGVPLPLHAPARLAAAAEPAPGSTDPIKPNVVKTFAVRPAGGTVAALSPAQPDSRRLVPTPSSDVRVTNVATVKGENHATPAKVASAAANVPVTGTVTESAARARGGWMIQVGAFDAESEAKERLNTCQSKIKDILADADPFTERVKKGDKALYRARFAGLEKHQAEVACKSLKRNDIPCMLLKN